MTSLRLPLSVREGTGDQPALREGVPGFVEEELRGWIFRTASQAPDQAKHALIRLGFTLPAEYRRRRADYKKQQPRLVPAALPALRQLPAARPGLPGHPAAGTLPAVTDELTVPDELTARRDRGTGALP